MINLDNKDHQIIESLRKDARSSVRDIAKKTKLRPSTVHQRIQKLRKEGVIEKFTLKLDNKAMGENFVVFMLIKSEREIESKVFMDKHIKEVFGVTGEYDLFLKLKFKDIEEFNSFVIKFRKEQKLSATLTLVSTLVIKEEI